MVLRICCRSQQAWPPQASAVSTLSLTLHYGQQEEGELPKSVLATSHSHPCQQPSASAAAVNTLPAAGRSSVA